MIIQDDRTDEQKDSHYILVVGTDKFMSGWGQAEGGKSYAAWACDLNNWHIVKSWVNNRGDMQRVRVIHAHGYNPRGKGHLHIYVVDEKHNSLKGY